MISISILQCRRAVIPADGYAAGTSVHTIAAWFLAWKRSSLLPTAFLRINWIGATPLSWLLSAHTSLILARPS